MNNDNAKIDDSAKNKKSSVDEADKKTEQAQDIPIGNKEKMNGNEDEENRTRKSNYSSSKREVTEECLKSIFNERNKTELFSIILNRFRAIHREVSDEFKYDKIITILLEYCLTSKEAFRRLWETIEEKYPEQWKEYSDFLKDASDQEGYNDLIKKTQRKRFREEQQKSSLGEENVIKWFFDTLDCAEQSIVITAALFHGVERNIFNELTHDIHRLLFLVVQEPPKNEPSSSVNKEDADAQEEKRVPPRLRNEQEMFHRAKIKFVLDKRNSHYGLTDVEVVNFESAGYQTEILKIIKDNLSSKKKLIFDFIASLGENKNSEKRFFAVNAVVTLSETHLFQELLDYIISEWANTKDYYTHQATASALSNILLQGRQKNEILALLNSWQKTDNFFLNRTSISTYYLIADEYPKEALHAIESSSNRESVFLTLKCLDIARKVYRKELSFFITCLSEWIQDERLALRQQAGVYFFYFINIDDAVSSQDTREKTVKIIAALWESRNMPQRLKIQQETVEKVKEWAEEALSSLERDEREAFLKYQALFYELYREWSDKLAYYFEKWQENREYKQQRSIERGISSESLSAARKINFSLLIPTEA